MSNHFSGFFVGVFAIVILMIWASIHLWYIIIPIIVVIVIWYLSSQKPEKLRPNKISHPHFEKKNKDRQREQRLANQLEKIKKEQQNLLKFEEIDISELKEFMSFAKIWKNRMENQDRDIFRN